MKRIQLTKGFYTLIDDEDYDIVSKYSWHYNIAGYAAHGTHKTINGKRTVVYELLHRYLLSVPKGLYVDHINGDKLDNRRKNLRICTNAQNMQWSRRPKNNRSGYKGVCWDKRRKKWIVQVGGEGKHFVGYFNNLINAAKEYDRVALERFGEFAKINFPQE